MAQPHCGLWLPKEMSPWLGGAYIALVGSAGFLLCLAPLPFHRPWLTSKLSSLGYKPHVACTRIAAQGTLAVSSALKFELLEVLSINSRADIKAERLD